MESDDDVKGGACTDVHLNNVYSLHFKKAQAICSARKLIIIYYVSGIKFDNVMV